MRILLTGCAGFIGFHLAEDLLRLKHDVVGIDNLDNYYDQTLKSKRLAKLDHKNFTFINLDINNISRIENDFDLIINFAAQPGVRLSKSDWHKYYHSNISGFINVCNFCLENSKSKLIYASSSSVYQGKSKKPSCEKDKLEPSSTYGTSKAFNEIHAEMLAKSYGLKAVGFRFFTVYGPWGRPDMAYFLFSKQIRESKKITLHNQGKMFRDMTYIEDIVSGVSSGIDILMKKDFLGHEVFNLGCNDPIETKQLVNFIGDYFNKDYSIENIEKNYESQYTHADLTKAKNILGYNPKTNFNKGMLKFLEWYEKYEQD